MERQQWWLKSGLAAVTVLALAACSPTGQGPAPAATDNKPSAPAGTPGGEAAESGTLPGLPTAEQARTELAGLTVAAQGSMRGYSRAKFPHWAQQGERCDTREKVLERDGTGVLRDAECRAVSRALGERVWRQDVHERL